MLIDGLTLPDYYRAIGDDPFQCSMFGCDEPALYFTQGWSCNGGGWAERSVDGPDCGHAHMIPAPMCEAHASQREAKGLAIVGTTGD